MLIAQHRLKFEWFMFYTKMCNHLNQENWVSVSCRWFFFQIFTQPRRSPLLRRKIVRSSSANASLCSAKKNLKGIKTHEKDKRTNCTKYLFRIDNIYPLRKMYSRSIWMRKWMWARKHFCNCYKIVLNATPIRIAELVVSCCNQMVLYFSCWCLSRSISFSLLSRTWAECLHWLNANPKETVWLIWIRCHSRKIVVSHWSGFVLCCQRVYANYKIIKRQKKEETHNRQYHTRCNAKQNKTNKSKRKYTWIVTKRLQNYLKNSITV